MSMIGNNSGVSVGALTPVDRQKLAQAIRELDGAMTRTEAERDLKNEIVKKVSEETGITKKVVRKIAKAYHKRDFDVTVTENRDFEAIYESVMKGGNGSN